ncbi:hypothetical protein ACFFX0_26475 [Citricoccus parietis]|uniref:Uncharacterized protein n=1 Tax=Citricoccus parietis TaxID=592307 RepID=A0ABV5G6L5_9MICC
MAGSSRTGLDSMTLPVPSVDSTASASPSAVREARASPAAGSRVEPGTVRGTTQRVAVRATEQLARTASTTTAVRRAGPMPARSPRRDAPGTRRGPRTPLNPATAAISTPSSAVEVKGPVNTVTESPLASTEVAIRGATAAPASPSTVAPRPMRACVPIRPVMKAPTTAAARMGSPMTSAATRAQGYPAPPGTAVSSHGRASRPESAAKASGKPRICCHSGAGS